MLFHIKCHLNDAHFAWNTIHKTSFQLSFSPSYFSVYIKSVGVRRNTEIWPLHSAHCVVWGANLIFVHFQALLNEMCFKMDGTRTCVCARALCIYVVSSYKLQSTKVYTFLLLLMEYRVTVGMENGVSGGLRVGSIFSL